MAKFNKCPKGVINEDVPIDKTPKTSVISNYQNEKPVWQIGAFDDDGKWGYHGLIQEGKFQISENLLEYLVENDLNDDYAELSKIDKEQCNVHKLLRTLTSLKGNKEEYLGLIPNCFISEDVFYTKILPKLKEFEKLTWREIEEQLYPSYGKYKTKNHSISIDRLCPEAQRRLKELKQDDIEEVFSLRLAGKLRLFGIRHNNCFRLLWIDFNHEICPSKS